ncbi:MAG TPA: hypothetical protein VGN93_09920 [Shinella sp.]|jgi:hypothetical protein|uniref:hypothetical protein n=1 Tax=Shinella sp. TaxID=1870904 RepID=UPI002E128D68|nr:hypothetical protein [Shinella sp.]
MTPLRYHADVEHIEPDEPQHAVDRPKDLCGYETVFKQTVIEPFNAELQRSSCACVHRGRAAGMHDGYFLVRIVRLRHLAQRIRDGAVPDGSHQ